MALLSLSDSIGFLLPLYSNEMCSRASVNNFTDAENAFAYLNGAPVSVATLAKLHANAHGSRVAADWGLVNCVTLRR